MSSKSPNLQDVFLASARRTETPVTVFLVNGFQMRGTITGFDAFTVVLRIAPQPGQLPLGVLPGAELDLRCGLLQGAGPLQGGKELLVPDGLEGPAGSIPLM